MNRADAAEDMRLEWQTSPRWRGIRRDHDAAEVLRLRGSVRVEHSLARRGALRLWDQLHAEDRVDALGALTGNQAVQMVRAGLKAIYLSGWQVAADNNGAGETYPDLGLYPVSSVPALVARINKALRRADQVELLKGPSSRDWMAPIVADAEAGFGGPLNAYMLMTHLVEAGAAAAHFEDQLSSAKKCGHMGGKVLVPTLQHIRTLRAARLAADVADVPSLLIARTDARDARLVAGDTDTRDQPHLTGRRTREGFAEAKPGLDAAIARGLSYAPYAEMLWFETNEPDVEEARRFANAIHDQFPGKMLAYNCSPSFRWSSHMGKEEVREFQPKLAELGYKFQFVTLAGFHAQSSSMHALAHAFAREGMPAYVRLQENEFAQSERTGYTAVRHQNEAGASYFDALAATIDPEDNATRAMTGSTEEDQFHAKPQRSPRPKRRIASKATLRNRN